MRLSNRCAWTLILCLMVFAAVFLLACPFDSDGDFAVAAADADDCLCSAGVLTGDDCSTGALFWAKPDCDSRPLRVSPATGVCLRDPGLLAVVPGGLCLLI